MFAKNIFVSEERVIIHEDRRVVNENFLLGIFFVCVGWLWLLLYEEHVVACEEHSFVSNMHIFVRSDHICDRGDHIFLQEATLASRATTFLSARFPFVFTYNVLACVEAVLVPAQMLFQRKHLLAKATFVF